MELLLFNESHQITYFGKCTILADGRNGELKVTPTEEDFKVCPYVFKQHVIKLNNILFIFASGLYHLDFLLILPRVGSCNTVFEAIQKAKDPFENQTINAFDIHSAEFQQRSFLPILENIQTNEIHSNRLKEFICNFLKFLGKEERERYLVLIKENSEELYSNILIKSGFEKVNKNDTVSRAVEDEANQQPNFELIETERKFRKRRRNETNIEPVIRDENNIDLWYTYGYVKEKKTYWCNKCRNLRKSVTAKLNKVEDGEDYIELGPHEHVCKPEPKEKMKQ